MPGAQREEGETVALPGTRGPPGSSTAAPDLGLSMTYRASPLLRALRDVETIRQHMMFGHALRPHLARIMAGTDEAYPPFVI